MLTDGRRTKSDHYIAHPGHSSGELKRQITIILAIFKSPSQALLLSNKGQIASAASEEYSF